LELLAFVVNDNEKFVTFFASSVPLNASFIRHITTALD